MSKTAKRRAKRYVVEIGGAAKRIAERLARARDTTQKQVISDALVTAALEEKMVKVERRRVKEWGEAMP